MSRLVLAVDPAAELPPFAQIADQLREFIERGDLRPGDTLPPVRQLASDLNVAPNTVARAYTELQEAGWLNSDGRRGTRVAQSTPLDDRKQRGAILRDDISKFIGSARHRGYSKIEIRAALEAAAAKM